MKIVCVVFGLVEFVIRIALCIVITPFCLLGLIILLVAMADVNIDTSEELRLLLTPILWSKSWLG
jgi:hypothetical protein